MITRERGLDSARALATIGVVLAHASISYLTTPIGWAVRDQSRSIAVDLGLWTLRQVLMPAFFFLAGWLTGRSHARDGAAAVARQRLRRIALPLAIALVPMSIAMNALWDHGRALAGRDPVADPVPALRASELPVTLGHLWFLYYLLWITAAALLVARAGRDVPAAVARALAAIAPPLLAIVTAVLLGAAGQLQLDTPLGFVPDPIIAAYFGCFFVWGWLARDAQLAPAWRPPSAAALAFLLIALLVPALRRSVAGGAPSVLEVSASAATSWLLVLALIDGCRRWLSAPGPVLRAIGDASYPIYVLHLPLVVVLQLAASRATWPGPLEYLAIVSITLAATLATVHTARRWRRRRAR